MPPMKELSSVKKGRKIIIGLLRFGSVTFMVENYDGKSKRKKSLSQLEP